jgi:hypothetical protein
MTERAAQIMLPATKHSLHQPFGRVIKGSSSLGVTFDLSPIDCRYVLHFKPPQNFLSMCSRPNGFKLISGRASRVRNTKPELTQAASDREMERTLLTLFW